MLSDRPPDEGKGVQLLFGSPHWIRFDLAPDRHRKMQEGAAVLREDQIRVPILGHVTDGSMPDLA